MISYKTMRIFTLALLSLAVQATPLAAQSLVWSTSEIAMYSGYGSTQPERTTVRLTNTGPQAVVNLFVSSGWLKAEPMQVTLGNGQGADIVLEADPTGLASGAYPAFVTALPAGYAGSAVLTLRFEISSISAQANPTSLSMDPAPEARQSKPLSLSFSDGVTRSISWTVSTKSGGNWLSVSTVSPQTAPITLQVTADAAGKLAGESYEGEIVFDSPQLSFVRTVVPVRMTVLAGDSPLIVYPSEVLMYIPLSGTTPSQPVQILGRDGSQVPYNVIRPVDTNPVQFAVTTSTTPTNAQIGLDTRYLGQLPRRDVFLLQPTRGGLELALPVRTAYEPQRSNSIQHIADGGPFRTSITVTNLDDVPARVTLRFYRALGTTGVTEPWVPMMEGAAPFVNVSIPVGGSWTVTTNTLTDEIRQGWAEVISDQKVAGTAVFRFRQPDGRTQEAAVPISETTMQRLQLPFDNANGFVTSLAVINKSSGETARMIATFRDPAGKIIKSVPFPTLPPRGHRAFELTTLFPDLVGKVGSMDLNATSGQISLLGLRFNPDGAFTSFEPLTYNTRTAGKLTIPHIVDGMDFRTEIKLVNHSASTARVSLRFRRNLGNDATEDWNLLLDGRSASDPIDIPPGGSVTVRTGGMSAGTQIGWAEVVTTSWVSGYAVFRQRVAGRPDQEATVPLNIGSWARLVLPFDNSGPFTTSVAIANVSPISAGQFNLLLRDEKGDRIAQVFLPQLPVEGHRAFTLEEIVSGLKGRRGTVEFYSTSGDMSIVGLRFVDSGAVTSLKVSRIQ